MIRRREVYAKKEVAENQKLDMEEVGTDQDTEKRGGYSRFGKGTG